MFRAKVLGSIRIGGKQYVAIAAGANVQAFCVTVTAAPLVAHV